jgi:hypothetical protein
MKTVLEYLNFEDSSDPFSNGNKMIPNEEKNKLTSLMESDLDELTSSILALSKINRQLNKRDTNKEWCCINELLESKLTLKQKDILLYQIHEAGFTKIKEAFWILNKECENMLCEPEDLVGIFKRRIFSHRNPQSDHEIIHLIGRYINLTLIQFIMLKNRNRLSRIDQSESVKSKVTLILLPLLKTVLSILESEFKNKA